MLIATVLASPSRADLDAARVRALSRRWGGGEIRWLAPSVAAEFDLPATPPDAAEAHQSLRAEGFDLAIQPAEGRERKLLIADMDSTMIGQECIDELAAQAGIGAHVAAITARAMNGELDFEGALSERVALLEGLAESVIADVLAQRITDAPGARRLVATMRARGAFTLLVSGGFTAFSGPIAARLGFDAHRANRLLARDGRLTGDVARPILGREAKVAALREVTGECGLAPADAIAVGDGANDLGMLALAGTGVALHAKPAVADQADIRLDHADLTGLLYLQGIPAADFADPPDSGA